MPKNITKNWLICYDIANPRRLGRVHRYVKTIATPLQYSVFQLQADDRYLAGVIKRLNTLINPAQDDIRIYPLPKHPKSYSLGTSLLPAGAWLIQKTEDRRQKTEDRRQNLSSEF